MQPRQHLTGSMLLSGTKACFLMFFLGVNLFGVFEGFCSGLLGAWDRFVVFTSGFLVLRVLLGFL